MAYTMTPWGYDVDGTLPPLIDVETFNELTGGRYADDERLDSAIDAATASIRAYCGWHVAPVLACECVKDGERGDIWLPCLGLRSVESVEFGGAEQEVRGFNRLGRIRTVAPQPAGGLADVRVSYVAGFDLAATPDLAQVVAQRVVAAVALGSYGVASESAGGVSIAYSGAALADGGAAFIPDAAKAALTPYRLVSAHVA